MLIKSHINGRLRARHAQFRLPERMTQVIAEIEKIPGVLHVAGNPRAGSLLIHYDPDAKVAPQLEKTFASMAENEPPPVSSIVSLRTSSEASSIQWRKWVKLGMIATYFGGAAAVAYNKNLHVVVQSMFIGFLAVHLKQNRRSLFD